MTELRRFFYTTNAVSDGVVAISIIYNVPQVSNRVAYLEQMIITIEEDSLLNQDEPPESVQYTGKVTATVTKVGSGVSRVFDFEILSEDLTATNFILSKNICYLQPLDVITIDLENIIVENKKVFVEFVFNSQGS
jgi:tRNA A-37 threonylcarbamoyl transferase component Bud32